MCRFCKRKDCTLTKAEVVRHGPIIEGDVVRPMRAETEETPTTYAFRNTLAYYSLSALFPDEEDKNPHAYMRFSFDEDEEQIVGWESCEVEDPLAWPTEKEFKKKHDYQFCSGNSSHANYCLVQYNQTLVRRRFSWLNKNQLP